MRIPMFGKISLAAKVRLLFGIGVVLILAAALFVPWDRMQRLVKEQDLAEARHLAEMRLLERCARPMPKGPTDVSATQPAAWSATGPDGPVEPAGPLERLWLDLRPQEPGGGTRTQLLVLPRDRERVQGFARRALETAQKHPDDVEVFEHRTRKLPGDAAAEKEQLVLEYVRVLRNIGGCTRCHAGPGAVKPLPTDVPVGLIHVQMPVLEPRLWGRVPINLVIVIGAGAIAVILAVVVFYVIMKSLVLSPVRRLRRLADRIGEGDLSVRSTIRTGDEFERLAKAFNAMLERLQVSQQQLRQINESLNSKMDELARANVALFESNRLKSEFLARVSHELRTPLNSIIGFAEVLRDQMTEAMASRPDEPQYGKAARYADNILTSGRMLLELINDLLDLSKIEAGKMVVRIEKVVVRDLVEAVVNFMRPAAEKKNLAVTVQIDPELPLVETDGGKFQQILYNLFSNAVKFTPPRGAVAVRAWRSSGADGEDLVVSVSDTGPGIPPEDQAGIFEKFHQLDNSVTREHGGTGLGLAISQELAAMLSGRISLVSKLGEGSTFTLTLPLKAEQASPAAGGEPAKDPVAPPAP